MVEDLLDQAIKYASNLGASYAEARYQHDHVEDTLLKNGLAEATAYEKNIGVGIRLIINKTLGFAATNILSRPAIRKAVKSAAAAAKAASKTTRQGVQMEEAKMHKATVIVKPRISYDDVDVDAKIEYLKEADKLAVETAGKQGVSLVARLITVGKWNTEKHVKNTDGADVKQIIPRTTLYYLLTGHHPQKGTIQRFNIFGESRGWEAAEQWNLPELLEQETKILTKVILTATEPPRETIDLVVGPEIVGLVAHESCGHPGEADRMLGREAAQAGETYIKPELLGTRIGSDYVTIIDDPKVPRSFGYYQYDEEGVEAQPRTLIRQGILNEQLHNRETAATLRKQTNGASRANAYHREPIVRMANTFLQPGNHTLEELIEDVKRGVYIKSYVEWNIDDRRWNQRYTGLEAYMIENGKLGGMVREPVIDMTTQGLYSAVDACGDDLEWSAAYCGKGDPGQAIPVWFGGPTIRLRNVRLGSRAAQ